MFSKAPKKTGTSHSTGAIKKSPSVKRRYTYTSAPKSSFNVNSVAESDIVLKIDTLISSAEDLALSPKAEAARLMFSAKKAS